jgi:hypothetical protein
MGISRYLLNILMASYMMTLAKRTRIRRLREKNEREENPKHQA